MPEEVCILRYSLVYSLAYFKYNFGIQKDFTFYFYCLNK